MSTLSQPYGAPAARWPFTPKQTFFGVILLGLFTWSIITWMAYQRSQQLIEQITAVTGAESEVFVEEIVGNMSDAEVKEFLQLMSNPQAQGALTMIFAAASSFLLDCHAGKITCDGAKGLITAVEGMLATAHATFNVPKTLCDNMLEWIRSSINAAPCCQTK